MEAAAPSLTERRKQEAARELVRAAIDLFSRDGFEATRVEDIAAAAGCSGRTFYRYFGTKEDVLFHDLPGVIEALCDALDDRLAEGADAWDALSGALLETMARPGAREAASAAARTELWLREPALQARYATHLIAAERSLTECLCRHRGTRPQEDALAQVMASAGLAAYRTAETTTDGDPAGKLRGLLNALGWGLDISSAG